MPTLRTVTVKSSGGDYSSLSSAESGEQGDLVSLDRQLDIECYAMDDTTAIGINGWTTDPTRYIRVYAAPGEGHEGVWSTSKYRLRSSTGFGGILTVNEEYVRLEGLQLYQNGSATYTALLRNNTGGTADVRVDRCIFRGNVGTNTFSLALIHHDAGVLTVRNSLIYGSSTQGTNQVAAGLTLENCTIVANGTYGVMRSGGGQVTTVRNCYSGGNGTDDYQAVSATTCMHSSATVVSGSTASVAYSTANFVNVSGGSEDLHLVTGSALIDAGTDLSGTFTTDIDGATRSGTWDIGADEFSGGGGGGSALPLFYHHYVSQGIL